MNRLLTDRQVCELFGVPSPRTVRTMRQQGLAAVRLGRAYLFDAADVAAFIEARKICHAPIEAPASTGSQPAGASTSCGMSTEQSAFAQLARQTAAKLKRPLPRSSAQVIAIPARASRTR